MERKQAYSPKFRAEAVKLVLEPGLSRSEAARRLAIPKGTSTHWVAVKLGCGPGTAEGSQTMAELEQENVRLRKELAEARLERDILRKGGAGASISKQSAPQISILVMRPVLTPGFPIFSSVTR